MKKLLLFGLLFLAVQSYSQEKIGYEVLSNGVYNVKKFYTQDLTDVQRMIEIKFVNIKINIEEQLKFSNYVQILTENSGIYIEKKKIITTRKGKVKYKKYRR